MFGSSHPVLILKTIYKNQDILPKKYRFLPSLRKSVLAPLGPPSWMASSTDSEWWLPFAEWHEFLTLPQSPPLLIILPLCPGKKSLCCSFSHPALPGACRGGCGCSYFTDKETKALGSEGTILGNVYGDSCMWGVALQSQSLAGGSRRPCWSLL